MDQNSRAKVERIAERISFAWGLTPDQTRLLLGDPPELERLSYVLGIYKALRVIFTSEQQANAWLSKPNTAFGGYSALDLMFNGRFDEVRRYLDGQCLESDSIRERLFGPGIQSDIDNF